MQGFLGVNTAEVSPPPRDEVVEDMLDQSSESNNMQHNTTSITEENRININNNKQIAPDKSTVVPTKSGSDIIFCLQLLSKTLTCIRHLS